MQLVKNALGFFLALSGMGIAAYYLLLPLYAKLKTLILMDFDILPYIYNFKLNFSFLDFLLTNFGKGFILSLLLLVGFIFFYQAHKNAREKITTFGWFPLLPYALFYYLLKGFILITSLVEFTRRKKVKW